MSKAAHKTLDDSGEYVSIENHDSTPVGKRTATLDGDFTVAELEAAIFILKGGFQHEWEYTREKKHGRERDTGKS